jgi:hypothetical protein
MPRKKKALDLSPIYYCYILFDWMGIPRYVGKGKKNRHKIHTEEPDLTNWLKNEFIERTWVMLEEIPTIIARENISEKEAFETEKSLIKAIGRLDLEIGPLTNLTNGGDGASGFIYTEALRKERSRQFKALRAAEGPEVLSQRGRINALAQGREILVERMTRQMAAMTKEERSEQAKRGNATLTPQQRSDRAILRESRISPEGHHNRALRAAATKTPEQRREIAIKRQAAKTLKQRQEAGRKSTQTRILRGNLFRKPLRICENCGNQFRGRDYGKPRKYCSHQCYIAVLRLPP